MNIAWMGAIPPLAMLSPRTRIWWVLFFALFPIAYVGGVMLQRWEERGARVDGATDRAAAIQTAEQFAQSKGFDVAGWNRYAIATTNEQLLEYQSQSKLPDSAASGMLPPAREIQVLFRSPDVARDVRVFLSLNGRVTGYDIGRSSSSDHKGGTTKIGVLQINSSGTQDRDIETPKVTQDQNAEAIARRALEADVALSRLLKLGPAKISTSSEDPARSDVEWDASPVGETGLSYHIKVSIRDSKVVQQRVEANVDKGFAKSSVSKKSRLPVFLDVIYSLFLTFGALYAIYRYAKRTLQREVSHVRTLVVAVLFTVSFSALTYSIGVDQVAVRLSGEIFQKITIISYAMSIFVFAIMGLLVGIGYGSGEGEAREAFPGKLTSLDALLAGRIFSQNVSASILFGAAAAGWLFFCQHAIGHFLRADVMALRNEALHYTFSRLPWLTLLVGKQYDSLLIAVAGLLLPASFLVRRGLRRRRRYAWLIVFALLSVLQDAASYQTADWSLLAVLILASALLIPFFLFDLLAAMVSLSALSYCNELAMLSSVFPSWTEFSIIFAMLAAASLALAVYLALYGRRVREEEVRPTYARNLAERMSMQAEILAAREAQLRLLPQAAPELPGVQLAACCLPARGVGGDFYDFFPLDANRVAIFVAQGGSEGLASALRIALAKGILMHASTGPHSPTQILLQLERSIAELLKGDGASGISFAYGVMDTRRKLLNYARVGSSPRVVVHRRASGLTNSAQLEREVAVENRPGKAARVHEGAVLVEKGDYLIFFTDGMISLQGRGQGKREYQWLELLMRGLERQNEPLQASLLAALTKYQNHAAEDLTAVVIRVVESQPIPQEVVA